VTPVGADTLFAAWDKNKDGVLSKDEFRAGWTAARDEAVLQRLHAEFTRRDEDGSGKIDTAEYAKLAIVQRAGKDAPMLSAFDGNKDNALEFEEYLDFVRTSMKTLQSTAAPAPAAKQ
jgi:hypothetical protein